MERLNELLDNAERAHATLEELLTAGVSDAVRRDASIQRFEYAFETTWKALKRHLAIVEGMDAGSPKALARSALQAGLLTPAETEAALLLIDDRNLTVHTYNEELARAVSNRLPAHAALIRTILDRMKRRAGSADAAEA